MEYVGKDILNPFERGPRLSHSPVRPTSLNTAPTLGITDPVADPVEQENEENAFLCLGRLINDLKVIIGSGKRSINQNLRDLGKAITFSYDQVVAEEVGKAKPRTKDTKYSQTTPSLGITRKGQNGPMYEHRVRYYQYKDRLGKRMKFLNPWSMSHKRQLWQIWRGKNSGGRVINDK